MIDFARPALAMGLIWSGVATLVPAAPHAARAQSSACASLTSALEKSGDAMSPVTITQAREYQRRGDEASCRLALQRVELGAVPSAQPATGPPAGTDQAATAPPAVPSPDGPAVRNVTASQLKSLAVWNDKERLGDIRRIAAGPDGKRYALTAAGGFLGIGEKLVALPLDGLRHNGDRLVSTMTEPQIRALPDVSNDTAYRDLDAAETIAMRP